MATQIDDVLRHLRAPTENPNADGSIPTSLHQFQWSILTKHLGLKAQERSLQEHARAQVLDLAKASEKISEAVQTIQTEAPGQPGYDPEKPFAADVHPELVALIEKVLGIVGT